MLDTFKDLGFHYATLAGVTVSKNDVIVPPSKEAILEDYEDQVAEVQEQYDDGLITQEERHLAVTDKLERGDGRGGRGDDRQHRRAPTA